MARTKLSLVLADFEGEISRAKKLTHSLSFGRGVTRGRFTQRQFELVVELAYLRGYLAWETYLEQTFILYLMGKHSPSGYAPTRYALPVNRQHARDFSRGDLRYADWTASDKVVARAKNFFENGEPYSLALPNQQRELQDMKVLRNSIAHMSEESTDAFQRLVRRAITFYPAGLSVGAFLDRQHPGTIPASTFLEHYLDVLLQAARDIVP